MDWLDTITICLLCVKFMREFQFQVKTNVGKFDLWVWAPLRQGCSGHVKSAGDQGKVMAMVASSYFPKMSNLFCHSYLSLRKPFQVYAQISLSPKIAGAYAKQK